MSDRKPMSNTKLLTVADYKLHQSLNPRLRSTKYSTASLAIKLLYYFGGMEIINLSLLVVVKCNEAGIITIACM